MLTPGLKPGRVIQVTFCPDQVGLTFIRYLGLTWILYCITCVDDGAWPSDDGSVFPNSAKMFQIWSLMVTIFVEHGSNFKSC